MSKLTYILLSVFSLLFFLPTVAMAHTVIPSDGATCPANHETSFELGRVVCVDSGPLAYYPSCGEAVIENNDDGNSTADSLAKVDLPFNLKVIPFGHPSRTENYGFPKGNYRVQFYDASGNIQTMGTVEARETQISFDPLDGKFLRIDTGDDRLVFRANQNPPTGQRAKVVFTHVSSTDPNCQVFISLTSASGGVDTCVPVEGGGQECGGTRTAFGNFSGDPGVIASQILRVGIFMAGGIALIIMIFASYKMITSRGNPESLQSGRDLFTAAILGLLFIIFALVILQFIGQNIIGIPGFGYNLVPSAHAAQLGEHEVIPPPGLNTNLDTPGEIFSAFLPSVIAIAGMLAFVFLIVGGFRLLISRGDPKAMDSAKGTITSALIGLTIIISIFIIINILQAIFGFNILGLIPSVYAQEQGSTIDLGETFNFGGQGVSSRFGSFGSLISAFLTVIFPLAGIVFFFMLMWGGIRYMLSRGDDKALTAARGIITSALFGLLIIIGSFIIVQIIEGLTGINII